MATIPQSMNFRQLDKKHFGSEGEPEGVAVGNSADSYFTDACGRKYIDFMMGLCVGNLGRVNAEIRATAPSSTAVGVTARATVSVF